MKWTDERHLSVIWLFITNHVFWYKPADKKRKDGNGNIGGDGRTSVKHRTMNVFVSFRFKLETIEMIMRWFVIHELQDNITHVRKNKQNRTIAKFLKNCWGFYWANIWLIQVLVVSVVIMTFYRMFYLNRIVWERSLYSLI